MTVLIFSRILTYRCIHAHTYTLPLLLSSFAWTHMGVMQERALVQAGCQRLPSYPGKFFLKMSIYSDPRCQSCSQKTLWNLCGNPRQVVHTCTSSTWRVIAGDTFDSAESHFQLQELGCWQKNPDIPGICRWRTRQMMRSLPMLTAIQQMGGGGVRFC